MQSMKIRADSAWSLEIAITEYLLRLCLDHSIKETQSWYVYVTILATHLCW